MKRWSRFVLAMLFLPASSRAAGLNLAWDNCYGDGPAVANKTFACDDNAGTEVLIASFVLSNPISSLGREELAFDIATRGGQTLPVWWDFPTQSSCRLSQLAALVSDPPNLSACHSL